MIFSPPPTAERLPVGANTIYWLPASATIADAEIDAILDASEQALAESMRAPQRRAEYRRARYLVRALTGYGAPLPRADSGEPSWPPGCTGSITHKAGAVGVCIDSSAVYGIGIDAESLAINPALEEKIVTADESRLLATSADRGAALATVFAFKEALFKACYPRGQTMFYFHDAHVIELDLARGRIAARLACDVGPATPRGRVLRGDLLFREEQAAAASLVICAVRIDEDAAGSSG